MKTNKVSIEIWSSLIANGNTPEQLATMGIEPAFGGTHEGRLLRAVNDKLATLDKKKDEDEFSKYELVKKLVTSRQDIQTELNKAIRNCGDSLAVDVVIEEEDENGKKVVVETKRVFPKYDNKVVVKG